MDEQITALDWDQRPSTEEEIKAVERVKAAMVPIEEGISEWMHSENENLTYAAWLILNKMLDAGYQITKRPETT